MQVAIELQQAVLEVMVTIMAADATPDDETFHEFVPRFTLKKGKDFSPFTEDSLKAYREVLGQEVLAAHTVQAALDGSREKNLIWRSARGAYALEDETLAQWFSEGRGNRS